MFLSQDNIRKQREERLKRLRDRRKSGLESGVSNASSTNGLNGSSSASGSVTPLRPISASRSRNTDKPSRIKAVNRNTSKLNSKNASAKSHKSRRGKTTSSAPKPINGKANRHLKQPSGPEVIIRVLLLQLFKLAVAGIGISVIVGTLIAFWNSYSLGNNGQLASDPTAQVEAQNQFLGAKLGTEAADLKTKIAELAAAEPDLGLQALVVNIDSESYVDINSSAPIAAASTIKLPLLVAFLQDVDQGKIRLDEQLEVSEDVRVGQAGELQYTEPGTKISALETITMMITISDNTATNMIIKRLGGIAAVNQRFAEWGLTATVLRNPLPDLEGTNTTSPKDLVNLLAMVDQGKLIAPRSRDRFMDITRRTVTDTLLPQGIGPEARIAHKTGDIASVVGDAGIIDMPNGKRYIMAVLVKRPENDQRANELIREISDATYQHFMAVTPPPAPTSPADSPTTNPNEATDNQDQDANLDPSQPTNSTEEASPEPTTGGNSINDSLPLQTPANLVPGNSIAIPNN
jgi:beta-lactamase class A